MSEKSKPVDVELVACAVCQKEIPKSAALGSESQDYVLFFCGADCFEEWSEEDMALKMQDAGEP
jgi:hypothetical protein